MNDKANVVVPSLTHSLTHFLDRSLSLKAGAGEVRLMNSDSETEGVYRSKCWHKSIRVTACIFIEPERLSRDEVSRFVAASLGPVPGGEVSGGEEKRGEERRITKRGCCGSKVKNGWGPKQRLGQSVVKNRVDRALGHPKEAFKHFSFMSIQN